MEILKVGNAGIDKNERSWLLGHFMPEGTELHSKEVEVKWAALTAGQERAEWAPAEPIMTLNVLIRGKLQTVFRHNGEEKTVEQDREGDYIVWKGIEHTWKAIEDSVCISVRWPSVR